jgi:hypothetical protein
MVPSAGPERRFGERWRPVGLGLVLASRYLVACAGDGPASAKMTWIRKTAEGDKEADGG